MNTTDAEMPKSLVTAASQRRRNLAIALMLALMSVAFYAATFVRFGKPIAAEMVKQSQQSRPQ